VQKAVAQVFMSAEPQNNSKLRLKIAVGGAVQGVGFRPFVFRLAEELKLAGWVQNSAQGVFIEAEGPQAALEQFRLRLETEKPPRSFIHSLEVSWLDAAGHKGFEIRDSRHSGGKTALVLPDIATCPDCLREIFDPKNRRFRYPFTNCTHCGPRFSIIEVLPYDRANTSMRGFQMCAACQAEYENPRDRRFHAQPNACPACGPQLELWDADGKVIAGPNDALLAAADAVRDGQIVAVKGIGGFHLLADVRSEKAVQLLRDRKHREEKPFALMFPSLKAAKQECAVSPLEERVLSSPEAPIVLLAKLKDPDSEISDSAAPGNPNLGVMLPSNPLHHLLMAELGFPVVATSGNLSDEPLCTDEREAVQRLRGIADFFVVHNRPVVRHVDDSIVRVLLGRELVLRRARGFAPLPVRLEAGGRSPKARVILAVGAHLKNAVALSVEENVFLSQHIGDLETEQANLAFRRVTADLQKLYAVSPETVVADLHPDYLSTKFADELAGTPGIVSPATERMPLIARPDRAGVQHHIAHALSCIAENEVVLPALGVAWDGTGYGPDGTVWGGEFFLVTDVKVERVAHFRTFRLPGGDRAVKEPRRVALGLLYELFGESAFEMEHLAPLRAIPPVEMMTLRGMLQRRFNSPPSSSAGRLFDAVASLINLRQQMRFEGQAAMELEFALEGIQTDQAYDLRLVERRDADHKTALVLDWTRMIGAILSDVQSGVAPGLISARFHNALAESVVAVAKKVGVPRVALSGGCFQNRYLTERVVARLRDENFLPYWHQRVPPNDGGIALGQIFAVRKHLALR
jgi:hydrogenase maturation protein HypF